MHTDAEGVELEVRTAFGRAQIPALLLCCVVALVGLGAAIFALQMEDRSAVRIQNETVDLEVRRDEVDGPIRLGPSHEAIVNRGWAWYQACRTDQLLGTPDDPFAGTAAPPGSSHLPVPELIDHVMAGGLPSLSACQWSESGAPLTVPTALWEAGQQGEVDNPFYPEGQPIDTVAMGEARARLQPLLEREWTGLSSRAITVQVPIAVPKVTSERTARSVELALVAAATSVFALLLLFALAMLPAQVPLAFGLRGIRIGRRVLSAQEITAVRLDKGRLVVELVCGKTVRSPRLDAPAHLEPYIAQYQQLSRPVDVPDSPELEALRTRQRATGVLRSSASPTRTGPDT